jgi:translation initiation factor 4E
MSESENKEEIKKEEQKDSQKKDAVSKTKLWTKFAFWFRISEEILRNQLPKQTLDSNEYESQVKKIAEFETIEDFWAIFQHLRKPDSCKQGIEFQLFKMPIKPMWEDEGNKNGGRLTLKLRKNYTTIIWEEMILAFIGGIFSDKMKEEINGIVFVSKKEFNTLQIWFKTYDKKLNAELEQCIRDLIQIPNEVPLEKKQFFYPQKEYKETKRKDYKNKGGYYK